ncbi:MAG: tape measure protein [Geobacteraceae bacterium]|nr:tape measure protein [Geobacteraceae bacterium]
MADNKVQIQITAQDTASPVFSKAAQNIKQLSNQTDLSAQAFQKMGAMAMASVAGFSAAAMIGQLLEAGKAMQRLENSFAAATGSIAAGATAMMFVRAESMRLGLDLQSAADGYMKISAASKGTQLEGAATQAIFRSVAGASTALGLSSEQANGALLAISQMMSKGTVQAEELRGQLGERLPGAFQIASRAMGVSTAELGKMLQEGKVVAEDFLPKFAAELEKTFPPGEKAMSGLTAETNRLKTAWFDLNATVMASGGDSMFSGIIRGMKGLTEETSNFIRTLNSGGMGAKLGALIAPGPMYLAALSSGTLDKNRPLSPASPFDLNMISGVDPGVGPSGGASYLMGNADNIFAPSVNIPMPSKETLKEYDKAHKKKTKQLHMWEEETDLLYKNMQEYAKQAKEQYTQLYEAAGSVAGEGQATANVFKINTMQTGDLTTDRYKVTKLADYRLMTNKQYSIPQTPRSPLDAAAEAAKAQQMMSNMNTNIKFAKGDEYGGQIDMLEEQRKQREAYIEKEITDNDNKNALLLKSDEEYAAMKKRLDESTAKTAIDSLGNSMSSLGQTLMQGNKEQFEAGKKMAIAGATIQMMLGAVNAFTAMSSIPYVGPALGALAAAAVIAQGTSNIMMIEQQHYEARALGGPVLGGTSYLVGERGPEIFTPGASGQITSNDKLARLANGQGTSVTQVLQISAGVPDAVRAEMTRMMPLLRAQAVSAVKQAQRGGAMQ